MRRGCVTATWNLTFSRLGTEKRATKNVQLVLQQVLQNELNNDAARYTTHIRPVLQQIRLLTGLNMGGKTRNIAIKLILQQ